MAGGAQQQGNASDNSAAILWWVAAIFAALGFTWYAFKDYIISGYLLVKLYEIDFLTYLAGFFSRYINFDPNSFYQLRNVISYARMNPSTLGFNDVMTIGTAAGNWLKIPFALLMIILAVAIYFGNTARVFRRIYSMQDLAKVEKTNWPQITPVIGLDLIKADIDVGPWAMAMSPMQFCKRFKLLQEVKPERREGMNRKDWDKVEVVLKRGDANKIFALQLGPVWQGTDKLPEHVRALFAVFAARINADTKPAAELLNRINVSASGRLDFSGTDELLKKHEKSKLVQEIVTSHAYVSTVMASMLEAARQDGVQASADFLWLKPFDRRLWYTLNTVGRQTPFIEVGGIFAHWVAEKEAGRKLLVPLIEEATNALDLALKEVVYKPDE